MKTQEIAQAVGMLIGVYVSLIVYSLYLVFGAYIFMSFWNWFLDDVTGISINWGVSLSVMLFYYVYIVLSQWYAQYLKMWETQNNTMIYKSLMDNGFVNKK